MTNKKYKSISISNLIINPDNDRFESVENEKQAIDIMLTKLGDKIYYIAIHILENGLSPKPFYVMPSKKSNKKFLVKEGNRRTTALKLMANIIRKSKFPQNPKRSVRFSGKRTKRSVQKRKARNTQKAETKVL